jgi:hypothetical protein
VDLVEPLEDLGNEVAVVGRIFDVEHPLHGFPWGSSFTVNFESLTKITVSFSSR